MADFKHLFRKASLTPIDGLLLFLWAASVGYLSVPPLAKLGVGLGNKADTSGDIRVLGVVVFLGILFLGVVAVFCAALVAGCFILAVLPNSTRLFARIGLLVVLLPVFIQTARRGPRGYLDWLINPSIRQNEARQKTKQESERKLKASEALSVEREPDGIQITNNTDQLARVQVTFIRERRMLSTTAILASPRHFPLLLPTNK